MKAVSQSLPVQGSQPSTASPFKQDVFVYSASPGSESPSVGATATPVIMSRSPTGGSREGWGEAPALPSLLQPLGSQSCWSGWGLWVWDGKAPSPALPELQAAAALALAGQASHGMRGNLLLVLKSPSWRGCSGETAPRALFRYFRGEFVSLLN